MSKQSFFLGQNGGGSDGSFAIIKIDYPDDTLVYVEHEGEVIEAPSTKGPWMFGCDEIGLYKVGIDGTDISQEIEITFKGQIESTFVSPQIINYALIYYLGNEFANPSEDELRYSIATGGWVGQTYRADAETQTGYFLTNLYVNNAGFTGAFLKAKHSTGDIGTKKLGVIDIGFGDTLNGVFSVFNNEYISSRRGPESNQIFQIFSMGNVSEKNVKVGVGCLLYRVADATPRTPELSKLSNNLRINNPIYVYGGIYTTNIYALGYYKRDNILVLSDYGSSISEILSNATNLFNDISALTRMVLNCTGDFMISALSNSNFLNAMNASPNKIILTANEHWARFIALTTV